jgi:hypothetical protein
VVPPPASLYDTIGGQLRVHRVDAGVATLQSTPPRCRLEHVATWSGSDQIDLHDHRQRGGLPFTYSVVEYETFYRGYGEFFYSLIIPGDITDATVHPGRGRSAPTYEFTG